MLDRKVANSAPPSVDRHDRGPQLRREGRRRPLRFDAENIGFSFLLAAGGVDGRFECRACRAPPPRRPAARAEIARAAEAYLASAGDVRRQRRGQGLLGFLAEAKGDAVLDIAPLNERGLGPGSTELNWFRAEMGPEPVEFLGLRANITRAWGIAAGVDQCQSRMDEGGDSGDIVPDPSESESAKPGPVSMVDARLPGRPGTSKVGLAPNLHQKIGASNSEPRASFFWGARAAG